jgi:hypothetical protein
VHVKFSAIFENKNNILLAEHQEWSSFR